MHLFNGLLIRAQAIFRIGLPDLRLFIRGDEIDFLHLGRAARAGACRPHDRPGAAPARCAGTVKTAFIALSCSKSMAEAAIAPCAGCVAVLHRRPVAVNEGRQGPY